MHLAKHVCQTLHHCVTLPHCLPVYSALGPACEPDLAPLRHIAALLASIPIKPAACHHRLVRLSTEAAALVCCRRMTCKGEGVAPALLCLAHTLMLVRPEPPWCECVIQIRWRRPAGVSVQVVLSCSGAAVCCSHKNPMVGCTRSVLNSTVMSPACRQVTAQYANTLWSTRHVTETDPALQACHLQ